MLKIIFYLIAAIISYLALSAIITTPIWWNIHIRDYYWFSGMLLAFLFCLHIIFRVSKGSDISKKQAMCIAVFIGIVFSTYLDSFLNTSVLMLTTNCLIAGLLGYLLAKTNSRHKREDLLIFLWGYVPIKIIMIIGFIKGTMTVKMHSPFIALFIMSLAVFVITKTFKKFYKIT